MSACVLGTQAAEGLLSAENLPVSNAPHAVKQALPPFLHKQTLQTYKDIAFTPEAPLRLVLQ
ncbi:hypothetical protein X769_09690 [Mesorhizobium sp. LSJC268A00]|uniref:hypothetical protein n=1 Tax=unclassified Mesorhizobium TaxID=325217 RepID=UPI0003CF85C9|nr:MULTISPECIES: hypothetical protein [unclassified Mesorhizobium]ESX07288.1 hypothetical protein X769_09690 [Mesorhizobium sp. LSJC268A00]ESZ17573.1 hypothetical protein X735_02195 [Mesorhizobium sp. L2C085B000]ESZ53285.1 hypothetical protein X731_01520 [Mesorhizobium sp. L2C054A000]